MLEELDEALNAQGISLVVADMKDPVREEIERYELTRTIDPAHLFPTVRAAVAAFQDQFGPAKPRRRAGSSQDRVL
jgi:MFS superfamily sulfate permease-like transporter